jgi:hypothetical protein
VRLNSGGELAARGETRRLASIGRFGNVANATKFSFLTCLSGLGLNNRLSLEITADSTFMKYTRLWFDSGKDTAFAVSLNSINLEYAVCDVRLFTRNQRVFAVRNLVLL